METTVELIRYICKKRGIPVSKLEADCGFSNGYLNPKKIKTVPSDRLAVISNYLGITVDYLLGRSTCPNELKENPPTPVLPIDEQEVLEAWREATDPARESALMVLQCNKRPQS